jgi:phage terminase large subunit-like protein
VQLAKGLAKKDYEAVAVVGRRRGEYFVLDYKKSRGHNPDWTVATAFGFALQYRAARFVIQGIAYERVLKYIFEKEMQRKRQFWPVNVLANDKRSKYNRIVSTLGGVATNGRFFVRGTMVDFISQWESYPAIPNEDLLDAVALGMTDLVNPYLELEDDSDYDVDPYKTLAGVDANESRVRRLSP